MSDVATLIERAASRTGSEYKLARALAISQQQLSAWKYGRSTCSPADRARLAGFAGEDAVQELVRATLEKHAAGKRGEQLRNLLGKLSHQTGAASVSALLAVTSLTSGAMTAIDAMCRKVKSLTHRPLAIAQ